MTTQRMTAVTETYTYRVTLRTGSPWANCKTSDTEDLSEFGYSDQAWDALSGETRYELLEAWSEENFWNNGYEFSGEVVK